MASHAIELIIKITDNSSQALAEVERKIKKLEQAVIESEQKFQKYEQELNKIKGSTKNLERENDKLGQSFDKNKKKVGDFSDGIVSLTDVMNAGISKIGLGDVWDMTMETAIEREAQDKMADIAFGIGKGKQLMDKVQHYSDNSYVLFRDLAESVNAIHVMTGWDDKTMMKVVPTITKIGHLAQAYGYDENISRDLMKSMGKGWNDEYRQVYKRLGINKEKLKDAGWSGQNSDLEGYVKAWERCLNLEGEISELNNTAMGKMNLVRKRFYKAGRFVGEAYLDVFKDVLDFFIKLGNAVDKDGEKTAKPLQDIIKVVAGFTILSGVVFGLKLFTSVVKGTFGPIISAIKYLKDFGEHWKNFKQKLQDFKDALSKAKQALKDFPSKVKSAMSSAKQALQDFPSKVKSAFSGLKDALKSAVSTIKEHLSSIKQALTDVKPKLIDFGKSLKDTFSVSKIKEGISSAATSIKTLASNLSIATIKQWLFNIAAYANPYVLLAIAIIALVAALIYLWKTNDDFREAVINAWNTIKETFVKTYEKIKMGLRKAVITVRKVIYSIVSFFKALPGKIMGFVSSIPGKIATEFRKVPQKIKQATKEAMSAAFGFGSILYNKVMEALGISSPGFIQRKTVAEFENTLSRINDLSTKAQKTGQTFGENLIGGYNLSDINGRTLRLNNNYNLEHELKIEHEFKNVPAGIDEKQLAEYIMDDKIMKSIAENQYFQKWDSHVKNQISLQRSRNGMV